MNTNAKVTHRKTDQLAFWRYNVDKIMILLNQTASRNEKKTN